MKLDDIPAGYRVFIDSSVFIYHVTGYSAACRRLLKRCEAGELYPLTSPVVLSEVAHRLMMMEAVAQGMTTSKNCVQKLRKQPQLVQSMTLYQEDLRGILGIVKEVVPLDSQIFEESHYFRQEYGLLMNDSLIAASAYEAAADFLVTGDRDFERLQGLFVARPTDLQTAEA